MELSEFFKYADEQWVIEKKLLEDKGEEYTMSSNDKLENFKQVANLLDRVNPEDVIMTYLLKHFFSIINYVNTGKTLSDENIIGRIQDARNYLLLLSARIKEEMGPSITLSSAPPPYFDNAYPADSIEECGWHLEHNE